MLCASKENVPEKEDWAFPKKTSTTDKWLYFLEISEAERNIRHHANQGEVKAGNKEI